MEKTISIPKQQLFSEDKIKDVFLGVPLSREIKERLTFGEWSPILENLQLEDGSVKDAKIKFTLTKDGALQTHFDFKAEKLEIPNKILDRTLSNDEKEMLKSNKVVGPIKLASNQEVFIKVDQELNKVVVKTPNEIGVPSKIGEYQLSEIDKNKLANGEKMATKVLKGKDGYFLADLRMAEGNKGLEFSNIKNISEQEAKVLIEKLNAPKLDNKIENVLTAYSAEKEINTIERVISTIKDINSAPTVELSSDKKGLTIDSDIPEGMGLISKDPEPKKEATTVIDQKFSVELDGAIRNKDYDKIVNLLKEGEKPTKAQVKGIHESKEYSREEKTILFTILAPSDTIAKEWLNLKEETKPIAKEQKENNKPVELKPSADISM